MNLLIKKYKPHKTILFSSVVPSTYKLIKKSFKKNFKINCIELKQLNLNKIIKLNVKKNHVGSDRIANAIGSYYNYQKSNCIILDFGTATTFDVVIGGVYKGGVIAPGLSLSMNNLISQAEQIPNFKLKKVQKVVGNNTVKALRSGFFWGYTGLINNIIKLIKNETNKNLIVILTGGFSYLFKNSLNFKVYIDEDITIKGLIKLIKNN